MIKRPNAKQEVKGTTIRHLHAAHSTKIHALYVVTANIFHFVFMAKSLFQVYFEKMNYLDSLHCLPSAGNFFICEWNFMKLF